MRLLGLDFETTGLDANKDVITEIGAVIWCTERRAPLLIDNYFINDGKTVVSPLITRLTGIRQEDIDEFGIPHEEGLARLLQSMNTVDAVVAHNGERFDRKFFNAWVGRHGFGPRDLPWIDTLTDIDYPESVASKKLTYLAAEHGFLNPFAHRAVFDVLTMLRVLDQYDVNEIIESAKQPTLLIEAIVPYHKKDMAKERSFKWDGKRWVRPMKKNRWEAEEFPFDTRIVG